MKTFLNLQGRAYGKLSMHCIPGVQSLALVLLDHVGFAAYTAQVTLTHMLRKHEQGVPMHTRLLLTSQDCMHVDC